MRKRQGDEEKKGREGEKLGRTELSQ